MSTLLLLEDDPADRAAIQRAASDTEHCLVEAEDLDDFLNRMMQGQIELAIISLTAVSEEAVPQFQRVLLRTPDTKILALAQGGDGLTTLLKAESLRAHHLLAKPIDRQQFLTILNVMFPLSAPQD